LQRLQIEKILTITRPNLHLKNHNGVKDIMNIEPKHLARAYFKVGSMCEYVANNLSKSFNHAIVEVRFYPIFSMLEKIRYKLTASRTIVGS
jgi:hypothetical protein